jgi:hypothetical protein
MSKINMGRISVGDVIRLNFVVARVIATEFDEPSVLLENSMGIIIDNYTKQELEENGAEVISK